MKTEELMKDAAERFGTKPDYAVIEKRAMKIASAEPDPNDPRNKVMKLVDDLVAGSIPNPADQMGVMIMACVLTTRRFLTAHGIEDRGRRMKTIKMAVREFDKRLREHT